MATKQTKVPPITVENILKALQGVNWRRLGKAILPCDLTWSEEFNAPLSLVDEIEIQHQSDEERLYAVVNRWLSLDGFCREPLWRSLIWILDHETETKIADKIRCFAEPVQDPTLTMENVMEVMEKVKKWELVVDGMGLMIPDCKLREIKQRPSTEREKILSVVEYWLNTYPSASWIGLAKTLYRKAEEKAVAMARNYLPIDSTLTAECVLEVMGEVQNWWKLGNKLSVPDSKLEAIKTQSSTEKEKSISMGCYWVSNDPHASWEKLCSKLYMMKEERAVATAIQYLPKDPTLTVENVMEVIGKVADRKQFWRSLGVPLFKFQEMAMQSITEEKRSLSLVQYWLNTDPRASWKKLGRILYHRGEEGAAAVVKQNFPTDPTLTAANVTDVMEQVQNWESVGKYLHVPYSKLQEINQHPSTVREKSKGVGCFWVNSDPDASWEVLAGAFYWKEEGRAAAMVTQYLPNDPTLTTDNLMEVLKEIQHRWRDLGYHLRMPLSDVRGMADLVDVYVKHFYAPSWKNVAASLQKMDLHRLADQVTNKYVRDTSSKSEAATST